MTLNGSSADDTRTGETRATIEDSSITGSTQHANNSDSEASDRPTVDQSARPEFSSGDQPSETKGGTTREVEELKERYIRLLAEFDNFKKRSLKERSELLKYQGERIFVDLADVVDDFELALHYAEGDPTQLKVGLGMIYKKLSDLLARYEVKAESSIGQPFNPARHNAISQIATKDFAPGTVSAELKKVYVYKDKLIRCGDVVVVKDENE